MDPVAMREFNRLSVSRHPEYEAPVTLDHKRIMAALKLKLKGMPKGNRREKKGSCGEVVEHEEPTPSWIFGSRGLSAAAWADRDRGGEDPWCVAICVKSPSERECRSIVGDGYSCSQGIWQYAGGMDAITVSA